MVLRFFQGSWRWLLTWLMAAACWVGCATPTDLMLDPPDTTPARRLITQGPATQILIENINPCRHPAPGMNLRRAAVGQITATDGTIITVPAATSFSGRPDAIAADLYNECNRVTPAHYRVLPAIPNYLATRVGSGPTTSCWITS